MQPSLGFLEKILDGSKKIESRWYRSKRAPWGKIRAGETIFFKNSGEPVVLKAKAGEIIQFSDFGPATVLKILKKYGKDIGIEAGEISKFYAGFKDKRYCILIYLKDAQRVKPFGINKKGFGAMSAWITAKDINKIKL